MKFEKILETIINALFFFLGDKIKGFRTIIINTITVIIGAWEFINKGDGLFEFLCRLGESFKFLAFFCGITETVFYTVLVAIVAALNNVLRVLTANAVGVRTSPADLRIELLNPTWGQNGARVIAGGSILTIILMLIFG